MLKNCIQVKWKQTSLNSGSLSLGRDVTATCLLQLYYNEDLKPFNHE